MTTFVNTNTISFNGPASTADQFSNPVNLTGSATNRDMAWFFQLNASAAGVWAVTLQFNPDPSSSPALYGWQDEARSSITVLNTLTAANLAQTHGSISSGMTRGGVVSSTGTYNLLLKFSPAPFFYRLRFQLTAAFVGSIPRVSFSSGI